MNRESINTAAKENIKGVRRFYGVAVARVINNVDPTNQGRVQLQLLWLPGANPWARVAVLMAGNNRGTWFIPDVGDEVLIGFDNGYLSCPYVIGALWNGNDKPPETMDGDGNNYKKTIRSRNGVKIVLDDTNGKETLTIETPGGQKLTLRDGPSSIEIIDGNGNSIELESNRINVTAAAKVTIKASNIELSAAMVTVNAGISKFSGVVQADTVITNSVVSASYTPGAGNIW